MAFVVDWVLNNKDQPTIVCAYTVQINVLVIFMVKEKGKKWQGGRGERPPLKKQPKKTHKTTHISAAQLNNS